MSLWTNAHNSFWALKNKGRSARPLQKQPPKTCDKALRQVWALPMAYTPSKDHKRREREQRKLEKKMARDAARDEKAEAKRLAEIAAEEEAEKQRQAEAKAKEEAEFEAELEAERKALEEEGK